MSANFIGIQFEFDTTVMSIKGYPIAIEPQYLETVNYIIEN